MKFQYAPGLPGYGTQGADGSDGSQGLGIYFSELNGETQGPTLNSRISSNEILNLSGGDPLPGSRVYQTGDVFVDANGRVYEIDPTNPVSKYSPTGERLNTSTIFVQGVDTSTNPIYSRYYNEYSNVDRFVVDNVFTESLPNNYVQSPIQSDGIYGLPATNFAQVKFVDISSNGYLPYTLWNNTINTAAPETALAFVKEYGTDHWRWGNVDNSDVVRNVELSLDFAHVHTTGEFNPSDITFNVTTGVIQGMSSAGTGGDIQLKGGNGSTDGDIEIGVTQTDDIRIGNATTLPTGTPLFGSGNYEGLFVDTGSSYQLKRYSIPIQSYSSGASNRIITSTSTTGITAEEFLEYSTYFSSSGGNHYQEELLFKNGDAEAYPYLGSIKKEDRTVFGTGHGGEHFGMGGSRAADNLSTAVTLDADDGGAISLKCGRGGSTVGTAAGDGGNGGFFQVNGFTQDWARGGDSAAGQAGDGGAILMFSQRGGDATGTQAYPGGGGYVWINAGTGGGVSSSTSTRDASDGGYIYIYGAAGGDSSSNSSQSYGGDGSRIEIRSGNGGKNSQSTNRAGNGGYLKLESGNAESDSAGDGGDVLLEAGNGGSATGGNGGNVIIEGGNTSGLGQGGDIRLSMGTSGLAANDGDLIIRNLPTSPSPYTNTLVSATAGHNIDAYIVSSSATPVSDSRLKHLNSEYYGNDILSRFNNLKAYNWHFNEHTKSVFDIVDMSTNYVGLLAQDILPDFPEIVRSIEGNDGSIYYTVDYASFAPLLVVAINTLNNDVSTLTYENESLKNENIALISDVSALTYTVSQLLTRIEAIEASIG